MHNLGTLLLPLLGGYLLLLAVPHSRFHLKKGRGYELFLWSSVAGAFLLAVSRLLVLLWSHSGLGYSRLRSAFHEFAPFPFSGTLTGAFLLGLIPAGAFWIFDRLLSSDLSTSQRLPFRSTFERIHRFFDFLWRSALTSAARRDELLELQLKALSTRSPIQVTMRTRKVYVGWVVGTENLRPDMRYLKLVPTYSGFRSSEELSFWLSEGYDDVIRILERFLEGEGREDDRQRLEDMQRLISIEEVVSATFFDEDAYQRHVARALEPEDTSDETPHRPPSQPSDEFWHWLESGVRWVKWLRREWK